MQPQQGSQEIDPYLSVLVASGPQDERAIALVQTLRAAGLRVIFAQTVTLAAQVAGDAAACVAVLRPDTWKSQTIATIARSKPSCFIPVLAEPMELPRGAWTHPPVDLTTNPEQGEQELLQVLRTHLAEQSSSTVAKGKSSPLMPLNTPRVLPYRPRRRRRGSILLTTILLVLLIAALGGLLGYRYYVHPASPTLTTQAVFSPTAQHAYVYNSPAPGPLCDPAGGGQWEQGERYIKTVNNKKVEVFDKYTTLQCQPGGTLVTRSGDYEVYSELFFDGPAGSSSLSPHYLAQVNATIVNGDSHAGLTMDAHVQGSDYSRYSFDVNALGRWEANIASKVDGSSVKRLSVGFLPKASKTYTLALEVDGPRMTYFVDGVKLTTVTDTTYPATGTLAFGVDDYSATGPISALFSNFSYQVLPDTLTSAQLVATATAQAQGATSTAYKASVPGYNCDKGAGQWQPLADTNTSGSLHCLANGMQLTSPANSKTIVEEHFFLLDGHFPQNYKISADIDVSNAGQACAGLATRADSHNDDYVFIVCPDGSWEIALITDKFHTLAQGQVNAQNSYTVTAQAVGSAQSLFIDGTLIKTVQDTHLTSTDHVSLDAGLYNSGQTATASFRNFVFTPLP